MATVVRHSVVIKKYSDCIEELVASAAITPGHLVEVISGGEIRAHASAAGNALPMFAIENELEGQTIDEAYAHEDVVQVWVPTRGDIVNAILADGQTVVAGDFVESAGDGTLRKYSADSTGIYYPLQIVGVATEAVDLSGATSLHPASLLRLQVRIV